MLKTSRFATLAVMLAALMLGAFASAAQEERVLVIGHAESTDSYDPARGFTQTTGFVNRVTYQTLVTFPDENASEILPLLASSWEVSDDDLSYTFTLDPEARFASGNPVTAADVVFSINRLKNVKGNPSFLANVIESVVANEDGTVTFKLTRVNPAFLNLLCNYAFSVTEAAVVIANGGTDAEDASTADMAGAWLDTNSAGSGPYILESWEPTVSTVLVRNPNYWRDREVYFDRVIVVNIPTPASQKAALEAGDIDLALDLTADQIAELEGNPNITIARFPSNIVHFVLMNQDPELGGPVSDPRVQKAVRLALDYDGFKELWGGVQPAANLAVGLLGALGEEDALSRDLDAARALLAEAGFPDGFDITLSYPDFSFQGVNLNINAQKIQADLAEVGIRVTLNPQQLQIGLAEYRAGEQGFAHWFWGPDILDASDFFAFLPGGKVASERTNWDEGPAEIMELIAAAKVETDPEARVEMFAQLQRFNQESGPYAPFIQPAIQTAFRANLQGYIWHPQWLLDVSLLSRSE
ncbi:hypothetical protein CEN41_01345 [Fischerella thermalis CCMEE 5330]|uniref:Solute-binding protein family 5 domain-containing protein n=1 Tax=Fischerella thermalis CCMEE 5330 TaxID=2019670 RepID=A0A2N6MNS0_9CYAN|nr:hypothetical protein CEN41_01345 [Fischerella thermalis CCMEE 5330]